VCGELVAVQHTNRPSADHLDAEVQVDELEHVSSSSVGRGEST
jgi:hypothetical protein